jgi:hypothetical protein
MKVYCINSENTELTLKEWYVVERILGTFTSIERSGIPGADTRYDLAGYHRLFEASRFMTEVEFAQIRDTKIDTIIK